MASLSRDSRWSSGGQSGRRASRMVRRNSTGTAGSGLDAYDFSTPGHVGRVFNNFSQASFDRGEHHPSLARLVSARIPTPAVTVEDVQAYKALLYEEDITLKTRGAFSILILCMEHHTLEQLLKRSDRGQMIGMFVRVLREDGKKSFDLSIALVGILLIFSFYHDLHPLLLENQCGDAVLRTIEFQLERADVWKNELKEMKKGNTLDDEDGNRRILKDEARIAEEMQIQNRLLYGSVQLLRNLAVDPAVEQKMLNRSIIASLVKQLDREHEALNFAALSFLWQLSVTEENRGQIVASGFLTQSKTLLSRRHCVVDFPLLNLLYNISFEEYVRVDMVNSGVLAQVASKLETTAVRQVLRLLYQLTLDDRGRSLLRFHSSCIRTLMTLAAQIPQSQTLDSEVAAVLSNLSRHPEVAYAIVTEQLTLFEKLLQRIWLPILDLSLLQILSNVTSFRAVCEELKNREDVSTVPLFALTRQLLQLATAFVNNADLLRSVFSTFIHLEEKVDWPDLFDKGLLRLLHMLLVPGGPPEVIVRLCGKLIENVSRDARIALRLAASPLLGQLQGLLLASWDEDATLLQSLRCFRYLLELQEVRGIIKEDVFGKLRELLSCGYLPVQTELCDNNSRHLVKRFRFCQHNKLWLEAIEEAANTDSPLPETSQWRSHTEAEIRHAENLSGRSAEEDVRHRSKLADAWDDPAALAGRDWGSLMETFNSDLCI